jgi:hypothetical protein
VVEAGAPSCHIPRITVTPPATAAEYASATPRQVYDKAVLFVPVATGELGWVEGGVYWNGTYAYAMRQIYDTEGRAIGRRRNGPTGCRFEEYYAHAAPRAEACVSLAEPVPAPGRADSDDACPPSKDAVPGVASGSDSAEQDDAAYASRQDAAPSPAPVSAKSDGAEPDAPALRHVAEASDAESDAESDGGSGWSEGDGESCSSPGSDASEGVGAAALSAKLRALPPHHPAPRTKSYASLTPDPDFAAGWAYESHAALYAWHLD